MKRVFSYFLPPSLFGFPSVVVLLIASVLLATPGALKTKSGQTYTGDIKDNGESFTITVDKIDTQIPKDEVASVAYAGSLDDQVNEKLAGLNAKDAQGRVAVARFAFDNGRDDLAIQALSDAMKIDPDNADALQMLKTVEAQQQLERSHQAAATPAANQQLADATTAPEAMPQPPVPKRLLTPADINSIRQHELKAGEDIPIAIPPDVKRKFAASIDMNYNDFNAMSPADQLGLILQKGTADMKAAVKIGRDPQSMLEFKRSIQPMILRNCATSGCHGGMAGGKLILFNATDTAATYTNFYIMEQFSMKTTASSGFFGGGSQGKLIDRGDGAHSVLINFGLPAGQGDISHPKVPNSLFNGIFRSREDRLYQTAVAWMDKSLNLIEPDYAIKYVPPTAPTSQPATLP